MSRNESPEQCSEQTSILCWKNTRPIATIFTKSYKQSQQIHSIHTTRLNRQNLALATPLNFPHAASTPSAGRSSKLLRHVGDTILNAEEFVRKNYLNSCWKNCRYILVYWQNDLHGGDAEIPAEWPTVYTQTNDFCLPLWAFINLLTYKERTVGGVAQW